MIADPLVQSEGLLVTRQTAGVILLSEDVAEFGESNTKVTELVTPGWAQVRDWGGQCIGGPGPEPCDKSALN
ncbi:MAG: hypothetical protein ACHQ7M_20955, partial [Chloroflexota bacterium]